MRTHRQVERSQQARLRGLWTARIVAAGLSLVLLGAAACGGAGGPGQPGTGTVSVRNESHLGQAPVTVEAFYLRPNGDTDPGDNLLHAPVQPGGVVIVGLFPAGLYDAVVVLDNGGSLPFLEVRVARDAPTNFVIP